MRRILPVVAVTATLPLVLGTAAVAADDSGDVSVVNTETVQAKLDATGAVKEARVYEQLALTGHGTTTISNPVSTSGLRNLDGFGSFRVEDGRLVTQVDVDGEKRLRTVSDFDGDLPLGVDIRYSLDGKTVAPGDVVGRSGLLEVHYTITNLTSREDEVTFDDGRGGTGTATATTVVPMIGQLVTTLPSTFTDVQSGEAGIAGDGRGGTRLTFQMTLFPPIGAPTAEFGYTAQITKGVVPAASLTSMPVSPLEYPSFKGGSASYASGAESGVDLTTGAITINDNLLRLHDGAAELLAGIEQLNDGAGTLRDGLALEAAPGAGDLAAGLNDKLLPGSRTLADGLNGQIVPGARDLSAGLVGQLAPGAKSLAEGLNDKLAPGAASLAEGLTDVAAPGAAALAKGLNDSAAPGAVELAAGAAALDTGLASARLKAPALIAGLTQVDEGLAKIDKGLADLSTQIGGLPTKAQPLRDGIARMRAGIGSTAAPAPGQQPTLLYAVNAMRTQLGTASSTATSTVTSIGELKLGVTDPTAGLAAFTAMLPAGAQASYTAGLGRVAGGLDQLSDGMTTSATQLGTAAATLALVQCGLSSASLPACDPAKPGLLEGLGGLDAGIGQLATTVVDSVQGGVGTSSDTAEDGTLRGGVNSVRAGVGQIQGGGGELVAGLGKLGDGASKLSTGAGRGSA